MLVVEDDWLIGLDIQRVVEGNGGRTVLARSVAEARATLVEHTLFSVCLLDLNLGGDDGRILIDDLNRRSIPLVLATGYGDLWTAARTSCWPNHSRIAK